jgi:hypothetical protein
MRKAAAENGIPPEAVTFEIKGYKGPLKEDVTKLPDATLLKCKCFDGCICCTWKPF